MKTETDRQDSQRSTGEQTGQPEKHRRTDRTAREAQANRQDSQRSTDKQTGQPEKHRRTDRTAREAQANSQRQNPFLIKPQSCPSGAVWWTS